MESMIVSEQTAELHKTPRQYYGLKACVLAAALLLPSSLWQPAALAEKTPQPAATQPAATLPDDEMTEAPPPPADSKIDDEPAWKVLSEFYPEQARHLRQMRENNPKEFARLEGQMRPWLHQLREARARNPELARLLVQKHRTEMAISDWQCRYREASPEQRKALMDEGRELAQNRVDLRLQQHRLEIQMLEKRLQNLKSRQQEHEAHKEAMVNHELTNMVSPPTSQPAKPAP